MSIFKNQNLNKSLLTFIFIIVAVILYFDSTVYNTSQGLHYLIVLAGAVIMLFLAIPAFFLANLPSNQKRILGAILGTAIMSVLAIFIDGQTNPIMAAINFLVVLLLVLLQVAAVVWVWMTPEL